MANSDNVSSGSRQNGFVSLQEKMAQKEWGGVLGCQNSKGASLNSNSELFISSEIRLFN